MDKILIDREKRYDQILTLIEKYHLPVICAKINYPGTNKNTIEAKKAFTSLVQEIEKRFTPFEDSYKLLEGTDGSSIIFAVDIKPLEAKATAISIEEHHPLGRIFDIDVYISDGSSLGREKINKTSRKCILCHEDARICMKRKRHKMEDILEEIQKMIDYKKL